MKRTLLPITAMLATALVCLPGCENPDDIKAAWKKHIDPKKLVIIRAGDFGKK